MYLMYHILQSTYSALYTTIDPRQLPSYMHSASSIMDAGIIHNMLHAEMSSLQVETLTVW